MKKFLVFLLSLTMLISLCACGKKGADETPSPSSEVTDDLSQETGDPGATPGGDTSGNYDASTERDATSELTITVEGSEEKVEATLVSGTLGDGKLGYSIYSDTARYTKETADSVDRFYSESKKAFIEFKLTPDTTAEELQPKFATNYLEYTSIEFSGAETLGLLEADSVITASGSGKTVTAYLINTDVGVLSVVFYSELSELEGNGARLTAMLETVAWEVLS